jgi:hypothetical protein
MLSFAPLLLLLSAGFCRMLLHGCLQPERHSWTDGKPFDTLLVALDDAYTRAKCDGLLVSVCCVHVQVLRKAFPGVLLVPDVCGLERLPKV